MNFAEFREAIEGSFSHNELYTLCFDLGVPYENLRHHTKELFVRELIEYCLRRKLLPQLLNLLARERPHIQWKSRFPLTKQRISQKPVDHGEPVVTPPAAERPKLNMAWASIVVAIIGLVGTIITVFAGQLLGPSNETVILPTQEAIVAPGATPEEDSSPPSLGRGPS